MKDAVKATFDDLRHSLDAQEQKINSEIQQREETFLAERKSLKLDLENHEVALSSNKSTAERVVSAAPDSALLGMMGKLKSRLDALESQVLPEVPEMAVGRLVLDQNTVQKTKKVLAAIGRLTDPSAAQQDGSPPGVGTVTDVPADLKTVYVRVRWDCESKSKPYYMGNKNIYELKFAPKE
ncbi:hypothetical protein ACOMHN_028532 [Nucella lapillus]